jgi:hypothetical protein
VLLKYFVKPQYRQSVPLHCFINFEFVEGTYKVRHILLHNQDFVRCFYVYIACSLHLEQTFEDFVVELFCDAFVTKKPASY